MNRLPRSQQEHIVHLLLEGCSIRSVNRLMGVHRNTITSLLLGSGERSRVLMRDHIRNFSPSILEVDEAWTYVGKKDKRLKPYERGSEFGSQWVFIAMCRKTKLIPAFAVGKRTTVVATNLMEQLDGRLRGRPRIVTDALEAYQEAVDTIFGSEVDYRMQGREPEPQVSTSLIERQNLTLRNFVRRLARKTICFSKKLENLRAALSIHFCWYNFGRIHGTLGVTPAMAAGLAGSVWKVQRLLP